MNNSYWQAVGLAMLVACAGGEGGSCSDSGDSETFTYPEPPPAGGEIHSNAVRARVTQNALDFMRQNIDALLSGFFTIEGSRAVFYLDESMTAIDSPILVRDGCIGEPTGSPPVCPENKQTNRSSLGLDVAKLMETLTIEWFTTTDPETSAVSQGIRLAFSDIELFADMVLLTNLDTNLIPGAACHIKSAMGQPTLRLASIAFDMLISTTETDGVSHLALTPSNVVIDMGTSSQDGVVQLDITSCDGTNPMDPTCIDPACSAEDANCAELCEILALAGELGDFLLSSMEPATDQIGILLQTVIGQALGDILSGMPLSIETAFPLAEMLPTMFSNLETLNLKVGVTPDLEIKGSGPARGLDMGLDGGMASLPVLCALNAEAPDIASLAGTPPNFAGFVEVVSDEGESRFEPYHIVMSASQALITQAAWGIFSSGMLCFGMDAYEIEAMTDGAFGFTAGLLLNFDSRLIGLAELDSPMMLNITAQQAPRIRLGAGHAIADGVDDPHIELALDDIKIDISMMIDDVYQRVVGLTSDIAVNMGVERTAQQSVQIVVDEIIVANTTQVYNELAPTADLTGLFEFVVQFAVDSVLGNDLNFPIPVQTVMADALGIPVELRINTIRRDFGADGVPYLSMYASFCSGAEIADADNAMCYVAPQSGARSTGGTRVYLDHRSTYQPAQPEQFPPQRWLGQPSGIARIRIERDDTNNVAHEYQYRVDNGAWSTYRQLQDEELVVRNARLKVLGEHTIEIRGRLIDRSMTEHTLAPLSVLVDPERPELTIRRIGDTLYMTTHELGTPDDLQVYWRLRQDTTGDWAPTQGSELSISGLNGVIDVIARDLAGNTSEIVSINLEPNPGTSIAATPEAELSSPDSASGCAAAASSPLFMLALAGLFRRRRAR